MHRFVASSALAIGVCRKGGKMLNVIMIYACHLGGVDCGYVVVSDMMPLSSCIAMSQPVAARWAGTHPLHKIAKVVCADQNRVPEYLGRTEL